MTKAIFLTAVLCVAVGVAPEAPQVSSLCDKSEKVIFSCTVRQRAKIVSLCSSRDVGKDRGYLQYRFGLPGKVELEFPKQREGTQSAFKYTHYFRAQFDSTDISFTSDGYEYTIFDDYNGEQKPARHDQGIRITPNTGKEITLSCRGRAKADYSNLGEVLGTEP